MVKPTRPFYSKGLVWRGDGSSPTPPEGFVDSMASGIESKSETDLRDWFAGQALVGLLSIEANPRECEPFDATRVSHAIYITESAYKLADEMMKRRSH